MNAVHNSILYPSFVPTLDAAEALYRAAQAEEERKQAAEAQAREAQLHAEREEVRTWLATQIPPEFVPYVDLSGYTHRQAEMQMSYHDTDNGFSTRLEVPGAAPIRFTIIRKNIQNVGDNIKEFDFHVANDGDGGLVVFGVPASVRIEDMSDGDEEYDLNWYFSSRYNHNDFMTALGAAVALWREEGEPLLQELKHLQDTKNDKLIDNMSDEEHKDLLPYLSIFSALAQNSKGTAVWLDESIDTLHNPLLAKKRRKLEKKIDKFITAVAQENDDLAFELTNLIYDEIAAIIRACFAAGLAYGLTPCNCACVEDAINNAVVPVEKSTFKQWMVIEMRLRKLGSRISSKYTDLDIAIARFKGLAQERYFLHGIDVAKSVSHAVFHHEEI